MNLIQEKANIFFKLIAEEYEECSLRLINQDCERANLIISRSNGTIIQSPNMELGFTAKLSVIMAVFEAAEEQIDSHLPIMLDVSSIDYLFRDRIDCLLNTIKDCHKQVIIITTEIYPEVIDKGHTDHSSYSLNLSLLRSRLQSFSSVVSRRNALHSKE